MEKPPGEAAFSWKGAAFATADQSSEARLVSRIPEGRHRVRQLAHALHDDARTGRLQLVRMIAPAMPAARKADDAHAGGAGGLNAGYRILDDEALRGWHFHARGSMQE